VARGLPSSFGAPQATAYGAGALRTEEDGTPWGEDPGAGTGDAAAPPGSLKDQTLQSTIQEELETLRARNLLTELADRAISDGDRVAYANLRSSLKGELSEARRASVEAEVLRVEHFYSSSARLGRFQLPLRDLFPGEEVTEESKLTTEQLVGLLGDKGNHWKVRTRAAWLLSGRPSSQATEALVEAIRSDPNLDVVKECVYSFEDNTQYRSEHLFDTEALVGWWEAQGR
jgi:hypothetical protein